MIKRVIGSFFGGISYGCLWMVMICMLSIATDGFLFNIIMADFVRQAIGSMLVGLAFYMPAMVYSSEKLALWQKTFIHLGIGQAVYIPTAFLMGWIPVKPGPVSVMIAILISIIICVAIWSVFYIYYRMGARDAKKINNKIKEIQQSNTK